MRMRRECNIILPCGPGAGAETTRAVVQAARLAHGEALAPCTVTALMERLSATVRVVGTSRRELKGGGLVVTGAAIHLIDSEAIPCAPLRTAITICWSFPSQSWGYTRRLGHGSYCGSSI